MGNLESLFKKNNLIYRIEDKIELNETDQVKLTHEFIKKNLSDLKRKCLEKPIRGFYLNLIVMSIKINK